MAKARAKYEITAEDRTARGLKSAESRIKRFGSVVSGVFAGALGALSADRLISGLANAFGAAQRNLDKLAKSAKEFGSTPEEFRKIQFAAGNLGVDSAKALRAIERFDKAIGDAIKGETEAADLFEDLGVDPRAFASIDSASDKLLALASSLAELRNQRGDEVAAAVESGLVGRGVSKLFTNAGADLAVEISKGIQLGLIDGIDEAAAAAERAGDAWSEAGQVWARFFENSAFFNAAERFATTVRNLGVQARAGRARASVGTQVTEGLSPIAAIIRFFRDANARAAAASQTQNAGVFIPQSVPRNLERGATKYDVAATKILQAADRLDKVSARYGPN